LRDTFIARLSELAEADPRVMLITGDLGFAVFNKYIADRPHQFLNAGVAEQNMTGVAVGMALEGRIPFTYSIGNFPILRCLEQIRNDAAYHDANVKVVSIGGGFSYGQLGMSHHATEDLAIMRALPNVTVVSPGCLWETAEATTAIKETPGTCYFRLDKSSAGRTNREGEIFQLGKIRTLRDGDDLTLVTTGGILGEVLKAADELAQVHGLQCRVLNVHTLRPFDVDTTLKAAKETGGILTIEEHVLSGGLGSLIAETCLEGGVPPKSFARLGLRSGYSTVVGTQEYLRAHYEMDAPAIINQSLKMVKVGAPA
jgi:transketolase